MNTNYRFYILQDFSFVRLFQTVFLFGIVFLFIAALNEYKGESYIYVIFTIASNALLYFGFRKNAIFFDSFIGIFFWLGFWLKLTIRVAYMDGQFHEPVGSFDGSALAFDRTLLVASCAFLGLLLASIIRENFLFVYPSKINEVSQQGLFTFYKKYRKTILLGFVVVFLAVSLTNVYLGIYQRGTIPKTILPYGLNGIYKWLLLFGLTSISAVLLKFEYTMAKKTTYLVAVIGLMESFVSNVSLLSRGMILNTSALVYGVFRGLKPYHIKSNIRFLVISFAIFIVLFGSSVVVVNYLRANSFYTENTQNTQQLLDSTANQTSVLFLDRWVGIEGLMAVSSYPNQGWDLWKTAWQETYSENETTFYDINIIDSPYKNTDKEKHHFVSLPGIVAFCFYPGSYLFLFFCMFVIGMFASTLELITFKMGGKNIILCALLAQVIAFRFASFGYVPAQSYLLFGTIFINILMIFMTEKFLTFWYKR